MTDDANKYRISIAGTTWQFDALREQSLLQAALASGVVLPSSCRNGTCRTCLCVLREGLIDYRIEWPGLTREEKAEGYILPCVAHAKSDLVIDAPAARMSTQE